MVQPERMDKTIPKYANFEELKADEYRYWQSRPVHERVNAALIRAAAMMPSSPGSTMRTGKEGRRARNSSATAGLLRLARI